ncbi:unnamed protein product [Caenorhabditis sp. 36 PRJEB53466]|nr:unnamed protein product [Caenorhabditis sp. 36 PRJEB53466]
MSGFGIKTIERSDLQNDLSAQEPFLNKLRYQNDLIKSLKSQLEQSKRESETKDAVNAQLKADMANQKHRIEKMVERYKIQFMEMESAIRKLNETVVDLKGQIRVAVKVRHFEKETLSGASFTFTGENEIKFEQNGQANLFRFEHIFQQSQKQSEVFDEIKELILCALHGRNVCLIAYGPTGSGKTFTMRGGDGETEGIIPRAIRFLLKHSKEQDYSFSASFIEVYNEEVFDLLDARRKLDVKISGATTSVPGLHKIPIKALPDVDALLTLADNQRSTGTTACNQESSRSHAIFQLYCCLNLVDLAGSERAKESRAHGKQFTELTNINQSLTVLKKCIRAQFEKMAHVPYRESKLTVLLREYLGAGSSKTTFIAHVNPRDVAETRRTLEFTADLRSTSIGRATIQTGPRNECSTSARN